MERTKNHTRDLSSLTERVDSSYTKSSSESRLNETLQGMLEVHVDDDLAAKPEKFFRKT